MEYSPEVQRRVRVPRWSGRLHAAAVALVTGEAEDRSLNVWVRFQVQPSDGMLSAARFAAHGCPHFIAAADWMAERLEGRPIAALAEPLAAAARDALAVPTEKLGKLLVLEDALVACFGSAQAAGRQGDDARYECRRG